MVKSKNHMRTKSARAHMKSELQLEIAQTQIHLQKLLLANLWSGISWSNNDPLGLGEILLLVGYLQGRTLSASIVMAPLIRHWVSMYRGLLRDHFGRWLGVSIEI